MTPDCADLRIKVDSPQRMADHVDALLDRLIAKGAIRVTLYETGALASVDFGPTASDPSDESQPEQPSGSLKRKSATGGLVPRGDSGDS